jgi:sugar lactone lactonase YvrE
MAESCDAGGMGVDLVAEPLLSVGAELAEGPIWDDRTGMLYWVDILVGQVHCYDPSSGVDVVADAGCPVGAVGLRRSGGLVAAMVDRIGLVDDWPSVPGEPLSFVPLGDFRADSDRVRFNEAKVDPEGRFVAGTMHWHEREALGSLYQFDADGRVVTLVEGVTVSNGLDVTEDHRTLYYVDSATGLVEAFDREPETGRLSGRRAVIAVPEGEGKPDGLTLDAEGMIWVALFGGSEVRRYAPDGTLLARVAVPTAQVTSCAFGGPDLGDLFITTAALGLPPEERHRQPLAGSVFRCRPGVVGRPAPRFAG